MTTLSNGGWSRYRNSGLSAEPQTFTQLCSELRKELNEPLPGGRGFQEQRDRRIQQLARQLADAELPRR